MIVEDTSSHDIGPLGPTEHLLADATARIDLNDDTSTGDTNTATPTYNESEGGGQSVRGDSGSRPSRGQGSQWSFLDAPKFNSTGYSPALVPPLDSTITDSRLPTPEQMEKMDEEL